MASNRGLSRESNVLGDDAHMDTQEALDFLQGYIEMRTRAGQELSPGEELSPTDLGAMRALSVLVVKITEAADALADVNDIALELVNALQEHFGPKPQGVPPAEWIATLASERDKT